MALVREQNIELSDVSNLKFLKPIKPQYHVPSDCEVGSTVILDGVECLCVATDVTIQGSTLTRIAVDKNHDLGYYQKYVGITQNEAEISQINKWRWGGYETTLGNTSVEVGYGLQNTINCLANPVNYTKGSYTGTNGDGYPWLWQGVNDFRSSHSDKWFVPSANELRDYVYANKSSLTFDATTGGSSTAAFWSSSERSNGGSYCHFVNFSNGNVMYNNKFYGYAVRLCRAF